LRDLHEDFHEYRPGTWHDGAVGDDCSQHLLTSGRATGASRLGRGPVSPSIRTKVGTQQCLRQARW
jgi:hypothetical protein